MNKQNKSGTSKKFWGKLSSVIGVLAGIAILVVLIYYTGFSKIARPIAESGPRLLLLTLFYPFDLISRAYGWVWVYPRANKPPAGLFIIGMWLAQSVNRLIPTATIGGIIVRGRYFKKNGEDDIRIITSLIADKTSHAISIVLIIIIGLILILIKTFNEEIAIITLSVCLVLSILIYIFIRLQRSSGISKLLDRWAGNEEGFLATAKDGAVKIEKKLDKMYETPRLFIISVIVRVIGDILMAGEVWLAARLLYTPITLFDALTLRLITYGVRNAAFFIWGGLGVQESLYALFATFIGWTPASLIAISLATRVQEIAAAIPGVAFWLWQESYRAISTGQSEAPVKRQSADESN
jgi:putative membrane protein